MALTGTKQRLGYEDSVNYTQADKYTATTQTRGSGTPVPVTPFRAEHIGYSTTETVKQKLDSLAASSLPAPSTGYRVLTSPNTSTWGSAEKLHLSTALATGYVIYSINTDTTANTGGVSGQGVIGLYGFSTATSGYGGQAWATAGTGLYGIGGNTAVDGGLAGVTGYSPSTVADVTTGKGCGVTGSGLVDVACNGAGLLYQKTKASTSLTPTGGAFLYFDGTNLKLKNAAGTVYTITMV